MFCSLPSVLTVTQKAKTTTTSSGTHRLWITRGVSLLHDNMTSEAEAIKLLKKTSYFHDADNGLLKALAEIMVPLVVEDGYVFFHESDPIHSIIIVEKGELERTKLAADGKEYDYLRKSRRSLTSLGRESLETTSVLVDTISGEGRVTGLLHNIRDGSKAYATVSAKGDVKVWMIAGEEFREVITSSPQFALDVMYGLARELRVGSKSLRGLINRVKTGRSGSTVSDAPDGGKKKLLKVLCYDTTSWVKEGFEPAVEKFNKFHQDYQIEMDFTTERLGEQSATYAAGYNAVCLFVNDNANDNVLQTLSVLDVRMIAMRCAGFDRVDTKAARAFGHTVARVPAYSPYAVAEMAVTLLMAVNRKVNKASNRVRMANFTLDAGLMGIDIHGKTVGVMGTGKIGQILVQIMLGFGAKVICYDVFESDAVKDLGAVYVSKDECMSQSDVLFLMMPLLPATKHTINMESLAKLKKGVLLINTSRGGLIDTKALLKGLQQGRIGGVGMDVYENEQAYFFQDWSARHIEDMDLVALLGLQNVVLTAHQAFFTKEAVDKIVSTTMENLHDYQKGMTGQAHPNNCIPELILDEWKS